MVNNTAYEHGARKLKEHTGPDPNDDFSQKAAENKKPPNGMGLTEKSAEQRSEFDKSDLRGGGTGSPKEDAAGQSETNHAAGSNNGMSSANPRVLSGDGLRCELSAEATPLGSKSFSLLSSED